VAGWGFPRHPPSSDSDDPTLSQLSSSLDSDDQSTQSSESEVEQQPHRARANPSRLNTEWRTFFRDSLVAADTHTSGPTSPGVGGGTPTALPPPIRTVPNESCSDSFITKSKDAVRVWSSNANGISSQNDFAGLHYLCVSLKAREVDAVAIQEANTDFMQADLQDAYTEIFKEHFGHA
jgi:hypothetical protein